MSDAPLQLGNAKFAAMVTQRNPYSALTLIDGQNREISQDQKDIRRPGSMVYNSQTWAAVASFYAWKYVQNGKPVVRVLQDSEDGSIYDMTGLTTKTRLFTKAANAGPARFLGLNTELFFDDSVEQKKIVQSGLTWQPSTLYDGPATSDEPLGDFIVDPNGNLQQAVGALTLGITSVAIAGNVLTLTFDQSQLQNPTGAPVGAVGTGGQIGTAPLYAKVSALNSLGLETAASSESTLVNVVGPNGSVTWTWPPVTGAVSYRLYFGITPGGENAYLPSTGNTVTQTTLTGTAGTPPANNNAIDDSLPTNLQFMVGIQLTLSGITNASFLNSQTVTILSVTPGGNGSNIITAAFTHADYPSALDTGFAGSGNGISRTTAPTWGASLGNVTQDGGAQWINRGSQLQNWGIATPTAAPTAVQQKSNTLPAWQADTYYTTSGLIVDPNGNVQQVTVYGNTGGTVPTFATTPGNQTSDGSVVWTCLGPSMWQPSTAYSAGSYLQAVDAAGDVAFYQAQNNGTSGTAVPAFATAFGSLTADNSINWKNIGIGAQYGDITAATSNGGWASIPLANGGSVILNANLNLAAGQAIPLPAGFLASNMLAWTTAGSGNAGGQLRGVASSGTTSGLATTMWQLRSGSTASVPSNWMAVAWSADAGITPQLIGNFTQIAFTTINGDEMAFVLGQQENAAIPTPTGFTATNFLGIVGMATVDGTSNGMYGVQAASYDSAGNLSTKYNDNDGNSFPGKGNVAGFFWKNGGSITRTTLAAGAAIIIPLAGTSQMALTAQTVDSGGSFTLPSGFGQASVTATVAMGAYHATGDNNVCHGWNLNLYGFSFSSNLFDGGGNYTTAYGNIFAIASIGGTTPIVNTQEVDDSNGNLEQLQQSGRSGASNPTWATTTGAFTTDGGAIWLNIGIGSGGFTEPTFYVYGYKNLITKHVSTTSAASVQIQPAAGYGALVSGVYSQDPQVGSVVIFRPAQGQSTPIYVDEIPNNPAGGTWSYFDQIPDADLNPLIPAPVDHANDPPPARMTAPVYHVKRVFAIVDNLVVWSGGPDVITGSGDESFAPLDSWPIPATPVKLFPLTLQQGGLLIFTDAGIYILLGLGTASNPFYVTSYYDSINLLSYDAADTYATDIFMIEGAKKVSMISPAYPFDPNSGYVEIGFPIGNLLEAFDPSTATLSWNVQSSKETAMYVSDGASSWYRMSKMPPGQQGVLWHTMATIEGGTSVVQSVETTPGKHELLIGPPSATPGPILKRDDTRTFWTDNGTPYPSWDVRGVPILAITGSETEIVQIAAKSLAIGARPAVSILLGEVENSATRPWQPLEITTTDPPLQRPSQSTYSDRYSALQNGEPVLTDTVQIKFDYGTQAVGDQLLNWDVVANTEAERTVGIV